MLIVIRALGCRYGYHYPCETLDSDLCLIKPIPFRGCNCSDAAGREWGFGQIVQTLNQWKSVRKWDAAAESPYFNYGPLGGKMYQVRYDDPRASGANMRPRRRRAWRASECGRRRPWTTATTLRSPPCGALYLDCAKETFNTYLFVQLVGLQDECWKMSRFGRFSSWPARSASSGRPRRSCWSGRRSAPARRCSAPTPAA